MPQAKWKNTIIAESNATVIVDGNHYFPADSLNQECFTESSETTVCGWKGTANYYDVTVDGETNPGAAWYYANPRKRPPTSKAMSRFGRVLKSPNDEPHPNHRSEVR